MSIIDKEKLTYPRAIIRKAPGGHLSQSLEATASLSPHGYILAISRFCVSIQPR